MIAVTSAGDITLHDVRKLDSFVGICLNDQLKKRGAYLTPEKFEDCHSFLLETIIREHHKWDSKKHPKFSDWVRIVVAKRYITWLGKELGRGTKPRPQMVSYEALNERSTDTENDGSHGNSDLSVPDQTDESDTAVAFQQICGQLSRKSKWILETMAMPKADGYSITEIAERHDKPNRWVREQLAALRQELEELGIEVLL